MNINKYLSRFRFKINKRLIHIKKQNLLFLSNIDFEYQDDPKQIAAAFQEYGCCIIRSLNKNYVDRIKDDILTMRAQTLKLFYQAKKIPEGKLTPDGTLLIPTSDGENYQIMVLGLNYFSSSSLFHLSIDKKVLDIVEAVFKDPNIELYGKGQILLKEPNGGFSKFPHQDAAYFEFEKYGPIGTLNYCVDTTKKKKNGSLIIWPGSHARGYIDHIDTESHLGLSFDKWNMNTGLMIDGNSGDCIFFHQYCVHASQKNFSNEPRPTFINRYIQCDDYPIMPLATSLKMRNEFKNKIKEEAVKKDIGYMVRGRRIYNPQVRKSLTKDEQFH